MHQRQIKFLRLIFALYAASAFVSGVWFQVAGRLAGSFLIMLGSVLAPLALSRSLEFVFLRTAFLWSLGGLVSLGIALTAHDSSNNLAKAITLGTFLALAIGAGFFPENNPLAVLTLFGTPKPAENLRSVYEEQIRAAAGQEERNRLARDLHDSVKQQIFAIQTTAAAAQARFENDPTGAREAIEGVRSAAREAMGEMEAMLDQLRAAPLESVGLVEALRKQCEALQFRTGAEVKFDVGGIPAPEKLPPGAAQAMLRIAQEALANIARHARATEVKVSVSAERDECILKIRDNGSGFAADDGDQNGMGLSNMRTRAAEQGGTLSIHSNPGEGTRLLVQIPLTKAEDEEAADQLRKACRQVGIMIPCGLVALFAGVDWLAGMAVGFISFSLSLFVRYAEAADKTIRIGWLLAVLGIVAALPMFLAHNHLFVVASRGLATGLLISASVQFLSRSRA